MLSAKLLFQIAICWKSKVSAGIQRPIASQANYFASSVYFTLGGRSSGSCSWLKLIRAQNGRGTMILTVFAALGATLGYLLGITRRGFVTMAAVSIGFVALEIGHLLTSTNRAWMTLLPVVIGTVVVAFMLLGALARHRSRDDSKAA
jgi:hypothetical protein